VKKRLPENSIDSPLAVSGRAGLMLWKRGFRIFRNYKYNKRRKHGRKRS